MAFATAIAPLKALGLISSFLSFLFITKRCLFFFFLRYKYIHFTVANDSVMESLASFNTGYARMDFSWTDVEIQVEIGDNEREGGKKGRGRGEGK
jgi:hypothetical protein